MSLLDKAAKAAYEGAFLKHAPEEVDGWDDLVADGHPAVDSWRDVARQVILAVAGEVYGDERASGPYSEPLSVESWLRSEAWSDIESQPTES